MTNFVKIAENKLKELNKLTVTTSLSMLGDYKLKKCTIIPIKNKTLGLNGNYLIKASTHDISLNKEEVKVTLERYIA